MDQRHLFPVIRRKFAHLLNNFMLPETPLEDYIVPPGLPGTSGEVGALALAVNAEFGLR